MSAQLPDAIDDTPFQPLYMPEFLRRFESNKFREWQLEIALTVERICGNPLFKSHLGKKKHGTDYRGKRNRHVIGDIVIIFAWCRECVDSGFNASGLNDCCDTPGQHQAESIVFLSVGSHKQLFKRG